VPGRPVLYRTTAAFLRSFGLNSLEELPLQTGLAPDRRLIRCRLSWRALTRRRRAYLDITDDNFDSRTAYNGSYCLYMLSRVGLIAEYSSGGFKAWVKISLVKIQLYPLRGKIRAKRQGPKPPKKRKAEIPVK
jgi:hypothetical protein